MTSDIKVNPKANPVYFNRPQLLTQLIAARTTVELFLKRVIIPEEFFGS